MTPEEREAYIESLVESSLAEADEMEHDFNGWLEREAPRWRELGHDESWIRLRMETAQATRRMLRLMREKGFSEDQQRQALRMIFADMPRPTAPAPSAAITDEVAPQFDPAQFSKQSAPGSSTKLAKVQAAIQQVGVNIGFLIFDTDPIIHPDKFKLCVELLVEDAFGRVPGLHTLIPLDMFYISAKQEYERLGGVFQEGLSSEKPKRKRTRHRKRH